MNKILKSSLPHLVAIAVFLGLTVIYFAPQILDNKILPQHDIRQYKGMSQEITAYRAETGEEPLWTNSLFSGMPAYQISVDYKTNIFAKTFLFLSLGMPEPVYMLFLAFVCAYLALLAFKVNPYLSLAGALGYGLSTYFLIIIGAGHNTKMHALAYLPLIIAALHLTYSRKKIWLGCLAMSFGLGLQIWANHLQITYYTALIAMLYILALIPEVIKKKEYKQFAKASGVMLIALALALGTNATRLWLTYEYSKYTTRGQSELQLQSANQTSGLDRDYILNNYSYGISETMDLFIPNFAGGPISTADAENSAIAKTLQQTANYPKADAVQTARYLTYWGGQDGGTSGPVYIGAIFLFLFILGLFVVKGPLKYWLLSATLLSIFLAWGKHFPTLSNFFIDYFPYFNKFRTISMILVIAEFTIPLLSILALQRMFCDKEIDTKTKFNYLKYSAIITGSILLIFAIMPGLFLSFVGLQDASYPDWLRGAIVETRRDVLSADAWRSFIFVALTAAVLYFFLKEKVKLLPSAIILAVLITIDLWSVDKRYLNDASFQPKSAMQFTPSVADNAIMEDKGHYRVLNMSVSTFNDASTSYFHHSVGGYHGAKLGKYQELIEYCLSPEMERLRKNLQNVKSEADVDSIFADCPAYNMLGTKYLIYNPQAMPLVNPQAMPAAWFVDGARFCDTALEEIQALTNPSLDLTKEAIVSAKDKELLTRVQSSERDSLDFISIEKYTPNRIEYKTKAAREQLAVFSEIYYPLGWKAYIDGAETEYTHANYVLRAMLIPAGEHTVEFRFEPSSYPTGEKISLIAGILLVLLTAVIGFYSYRGSLKRS